MQMKVQIDTRDDFINFFQWASDVLLKGDIYHLLDQVSIDIDDIADHIETDKDCYLEFKKEFPEEYFGEFYVYFDDNWDRGGDNSIRMFIKLDEPTYKIDDLVNSYNKLNDARLVIANKYNRAQNALYAGKQVNPDDYVSKEEFKEMTKLEDKIKEKYGIGF